VPIVDKDLELVLSRRFDASRLFLEEKREIFVLVIVAVDSVDAGLGRDVCEHVRPDDTMPEKRLGDGSFPDVPFFRKRASFLWPTGLEPEQDVCRSPDCK